MYKFIKIRHDIIKQCHGNYKEMRKFNYKLQIEIFRNSTQKNGCPERFFFEGLGVQKGTQTPCWLRPCSRGTHLSCSMYDFLTATSTNCAAIYRLREASHLPSSGGGITLNLNHPENQAKVD